MGMPFCVIFSIFLIVIFIVVAFIAIAIFLDFGKSSEVGLFYRDLQVAVDSARSSQLSEFNFKINLPDKIEKVCFADLSEEITGNFEEYEMIKYYDYYDANIFLIPPEFGRDMEWNKINYINITKITEDSNPYCVLVSQELKIKKSFHDRLVIVE